MNLTSVFNVVYSRTFEQSARKQITLSTLHSHEVHSELRFKRLAKERRLS